MINVKNLTKSYKLYTHRNSTLKSVFVNFWKRFTQDRPRFEYLTQIDDITLEILPGQILCVAGPNGSGKSTFAKLLAGTVYPTSGHIEKQGKVIPFLELGVAFNPELTGEENYYLNGSLLGLRIKYLRKHKNEIFQFAEIEKFLKTPLKFYSTGMQLRLAFSIAMHAVGDIYIFDEILAVGDPGFQKKCLDSFNNLVAQRKTIIVLTHDVSFIQKNANSLLVFKNGKYKMYEDIKSQNKEDVQKLIMS